VAADVDGKLKDPKRAQHRRLVPLDEGTLAVLRRQVEQIDERADLLGAPVPADPFLFSDKLDCSAPMLPSRVTKRLQVLKGHLGVEDKRPATIALEEEALRLRRDGTVDRVGRPGPSPQNGAAMSYDDIGRALGRSQKCGPVGHATPHCAASNLPTSTGRASTCRSTGFGSSPRASYSTPGSISAWSLNARVTVR
jgi:hypothetical protein